MGLGWELGMPSCLGELMAHTPKSGQLYRLGWAELKRDPEDALTRMLT